MATAEKLGFQDATFLRMESPARPFHVAGLMILSEPTSLPRGFYRRLARQCGRLNELWPVFNKKLKDPSSLRNPAWVLADDYDPTYHVSHYSLPAPGRMDELLTLVSRVHERMLDRDRPLWEIHVIEGLPGRRFALYCKVHHALVDGVGALGMVNALFSHSPQDRIDFRKAQPIAREHHERLSLARQFDNVSSDLKKHYAALPQMSGLLAKMSLDALLGKKDVPPLPFTAPRTLFNTDVDGRREIIISELPLASLRKLAKHYKCTINDVLLAVCGGALRDYLCKHDALPRASLEVGVPMSIKRKGDKDGNQVGFIISQLFTEESSPVRRLQRIIKVMSQAKGNMRGMTRTAAQDFTNALMIPTLLLTLTGNASKFKPALNAIVSNVPGSRGRLYLDGAALEAIYPLSVITDGMGINITVVGYMKKLCVAVTSCPTQQPDIGEFGKLINQNLRALEQATSKR
ncbi:MAG: wax ester/triacylglycerol synthase family O-acyltransferase [Halieaceae bacterium]